MPTAFSADLQPNHHANSMAGKKQANKDMTHSYSWMQIISNNLAYIQSDFALTTSQQFLKRQPDHVQTNFNLAYEFKKRSDCQPAVKYFKRVLELNPNYRESHLHLSTCYKTLGDEDLSTKHSMIYKMIK